METITIRDVGPVTEARLAIQPGIVVITGANEVGKSTCIAATSALAGNDDAELAVRDGAKHGLVEGLGTVLTIGKRQVRTGELDVDSIEDRLDLAALVDPGLKKPDARNRKRIHALISLTGAKLTVQDFATILPDAMREELVATDSSDDPVELAGLIKRRMEGKAREHEKKADTHQGRAAALRERLKDVDFAVEHDQAKLQAALLAATKEQSRLAEQARQAKASAASIEQAKQKIGELESTGLAKVTAAEKQQKEASDRFEEAVRVRLQMADTLNAQEAVVGKIREQLAAEEAKAAELQVAWKSKCADEREAKSMLDVATESVEGQRSRLGDLEQLRQLAASQAPDGPDPADLAAAQDAIEQTTAALEEGARIRGLLADRQIMTDANRAAAEHTHQAEIFRAAARATDTVLSNAVDCETLKVIEGELTYVEGKRSEVFDRLSDGKRWTVAITEISRAIRKHRKQKLCVLPIQQTAFEGMDDANRELVNKAAIENAVCIVTAEHGPGPLSSKLWTPALTSSAK
jgi:DNA repair protein RecN (Recombination protein N)